MADLSEIQVGGKLRLEVPITNVDRDSASEAVQVDIGLSFLWLSRRLAESAEYIPPPTPAFKRGDWVKWDHGNVDYIHRHCLFLKHGMDGFGMIDSDGKDFYVRLSDLEPDEAPNV